MIRAALRHPLPGPQVERHARPAPVVDLAAQRDHRLGIGVRPDAGLGEVALVAAADDVRGVDRADRAKDLVLLLGDRERGKLGRRLHRQEGEDLHQVGDDHVAVGARAVVEAAARADVERLGDVDLHVSDVGAVPDRLEEAVGEAQREDVLGGLLAEEVIDPEDLALGEDLVDGVVERSRRLQVGPERLLHDDSRVRDQAGLADQPDQAQRRLRRDAQIEQQPRVGAELLTGGPDRRRQLRGIGVCDIDVAEPARRTRRAVRR